MNKEEFLNIVKEYGNLAGEKIQEYGNIAGEKIYEYGTVAGTKAKEYGARAEQKARQAYQYVEHYGAAEVTRKAVEHGLSWENYDEIRLAEMATEEELQTQRQTPIVNGPVISILVPVFNPKELSFVQMLESVKNQTYTQWELCIADASDIPLEDVVNTVFGEEGEENEWILDSRIRYCYLDENEGLSGNTNRALAMAEGEFVAFLDHDDILEPNALYEIAMRLAAGAMLAYTDEDKVSESLEHYKRPFYKPDYNETLLYATNYICHFCAISRSLVTELGGLREDFDGAQDYDLILRVIQYMREENADVASRIAHVPLVLYHWRQSEDSTSGNAFNKKYAYAAGKCALEEALDTRYRSGEDSGYGKTKLRVKESKNPGYYRVLAAQAMEYNYAVIKNIEDEIPEDVEYVMILPDSMEISKGDLTSLVARAKITDADVVAPRQLKNGQYLYNGIARAGKGHTISLKGKPSWYHGPYQIAVTNMDVDATPTEGILVRRNLIGFLRTYDGVHINRKSAWGSRLKMVYAPEVTVTLLSI